MLGPRSGKRRIFDAIFLLVFIAVLLALRLPQGQRRAHKVPQGTQQVAAKPSESPPVKPKIVYLKKASNELISHCGCAETRIGYPAQMDCPWCGCGWLFTCITCRKAFTFAEGVEIEGTWEDLAREDIRNSWKEEPAEENVVAWVTDMKDILRDVKPGKRYVILDGRVLPVDSGPVHFGGQYASHEFEKLPHLEALAEPALLDRILGDRDYWLERAFPEDERR